MVDEMIFKSFEDEAKYRKEFLINLKKNLKSYTTKLSYTKKFEGKFTTHKETLQKNIDVINKNIKEYESNYAEYLI